MIKTVVDLIEARADRLGDAVAYFYLRDGIHPESPTTYAQLAARARQVARELQARQLTGERVLLLYPAGPEFLVGFFGCLMAGAIAVPAPPPDANRHQRSSARLHSIVDDCDARLVLSDGSFPSELLADVGRGAQPLGVLNTTHFDGRDTDGWKRLPVGPHDLAYLQYTSGSTSTPKGIKITHDNLVFHLAYLQNTCRYSPESVTVTWMPNFHDWGLVEGLLEPFYNSTPCYVMSPFSFVRRPAHWLRAISQFRGTHTQGPSFAYEHCLRRFRASDFVGVDLSHWRSAGIAAEPINYAVMQEFHRTFAPYGFEWTTFCPAFGLGEATLMASCCPSGEPPRALQLDPAALEQNRVVDRPDQAHCRTVVSCGRLHDATVVRIVEPTTRVRLNDREVGEIWIQDRAVAAGYWQREAESREIFAARTSQPEEGPFLRTGDLGFLAEGELFVTGRWKDLIIIRGSNHYPQDIEWTVQRLDSDLQGQTGAAFSIIADDVERLVIVQEIDSARRASTDLQRLLSRIVETVVEQHEIEVYRVWLVERGTIPKTASGKIQRRAMREAYLSGAIEPLAAWTRPGSDDLRVTRGPVPTGAVSGEQPSLAVNEQRSVDQADRLVQWLRDFSRRRMNSQLMDQRRMVSPHVLLEFGNQGLFGLQIPAQYGGLELRTTDLLRVIEQLAAIDPSLATLVFLSNTNGLRPIVNFGSPAVQARLLPDLAAGRQLAAFALSEPVAGANIGAIETVATRQSGGGWQLRGDKRWNGSAWASWVTVIAREANPDGAREGFSAFLVPTDRPGVRIGEEALTVGLRSIVQNRLHFDGVGLTADDLLGAGGDGLRVANDALAVGRLCVGAVSLGAVKRAFQLLDRYAHRRRIATGYISEHPYTISIYQQACVQLASLETLLRQIAPLADTGTADLDWLAMVVKVLASEYLNDFVGRAVQLLGGRGFMENNEVGRIFRDAKSLTIGEGPNESLLGYLGQAAQRPRIEAWLSSLGASAVREQLAKTAVEISARTRSLPRLTPAQREQWASHLTGQVVLAAVRQALTNADRDTPEYVREWASAEMRAGAAQALRAAEAGPGPLERSELESQFARIRAAIGDLQQALPGEDTELDPELALPPSTAGATAKPEPEAGRNHANPQAARSTSPQERPTPDAAEASRTRLEQLLRARLNPDEISQT